MADINDNTDLEMAIARVQLANLESDIRNLKNARTNYSNRKNQTKAYKPNGVSSSTTSNFTYSNPKGNRKVDSFRAGERGDSVVNPRANEYRAGERGQGTMNASPKKDNYRSGERSATSGKSTAKPTNKIWNPNQDSVAAKATKKIVKGLKKAYLGQE